MAHGNDGRDGTARALEKRRARRVRLYSPIHAEIDGIRAQLVDLSSVGARVEASHSLAVGSPVELRLSYEGTTVCVTGVVVRCSLDRSVQRDAIVYNAGLHFDDEALESAELSRLLREVVRGDLDARRSYLK